MPHLGEIFRRYDSAYHERFGNRMLPSHNRAFHDIKKCRTGKFGYHIDECKKCGYRHIFFHSCGNRSCPECHSTHTNKWFEKRENILLPTNYFHVVFTLPSELRRIVRSNQKELLNCLMKAAAYALCKMMADPRFAGGKPGMISVLHTWSRMMIYHPHAHFLIAAGVISKDDSQWLPIKRKKFLVPLDALSDIFRARFMKLARKALTGTQLPASVWQKKWVVFCKPCLKNGQRVLEYLARYVHRIAISNNRILADDNGKITFRYKDSKTNRWKRTNLDAFEFIRRFLQHVLPMGFHKVRYYGFLASKQKQCFNSLKLVLEKSTSKKPSCPEPIKPVKYLRKCPKCKTGKMVVILHIFHKKNSLILVRPPP
jgi:hypothetical protein